MTDTTPFDPIAFNFVKLPDFEFFGGIAVYEIKNHRAVNGAHDFCRLTSFIHRASGSRTHAVSTSSNGRIDGGYSRNVCGRAGV